jgi:RNA polymerase sigma-70 factor, ECF subfamily
MHIIVSFHKKNWTFFKLFFIYLTISYLRFFKKNKSQYSDQELLDAYREKNDQSLLAELFTRYTHMIYGVCMKYLKNPDDTSDAVMNIYEKLSSDINRHKILKFSTWLYVITKNHCLMELRSRKTEEKNHKNWQDYSQIFMESEDFLHPIDEIELHTEQLKLCIEQLKAEQKECIELFYYKNKCYLEIAELLVIDEKKVKSYLQNGKRNLKLCMENANDKEQ